MAEQTNIIKPENNVSLYNRHILEMTGVVDVSSLSSETVEMTLHEGYVAVDGDNLKIDSFSSETGKVRIIGEVSGISYFGRTTSKKGLFRK